MSALAANSLVQRQVSVGDEPRFLMLETIREYGLERLEEHAEMDEVGALHAAWYAALGEQARKHLSGSQAPTWMAQLERDLGNVHASLAWMRDHGEGESMLRLASSLFLFWERHNHAREGIQWLEEALAHGEDVPVVLRAAGLKVQACLMWGLDFDLPRARVLAQESIALYRGAEIDQEGLAQSLQCLGLIEGAAGNPAKATPLWEESLAIERRLNSPGSIAMVLCMLGTHASLEGNVERGRVLFQEALEFSRIAGDPWEIGCCLSDLASAAAEDGDHARARDLWLEALAAYQTIGDRRQIAHTLVHLAGIAVDCGDSTHAVRLLAVTEVIRSQIGLPHTGAHHTGHVQTVADARPLTARCQGRISQYSARARSHLSESAWAEAWAEGVAMTKATGIDFALSADIAL
jgi:tetratricopeptide (TPR) repeat protein